MRIDELPDDILLETFDFYVWNPSYEDEPEIEAWKTLVHVCRRWRILVFESPRHLNLRLFCTPETRVKDRLDVWPAFPLIVWGIMTSQSGIDNVIAALRQCNRVREVSFCHLAGWQLEKIMAAMQVSLPNLVRLCLHSEDETLPDIPDSFWVDLPYVCKSSS